MKYLVVDCTKTFPIRGVGDAGMGMGSTKALTRDELPKYAVWLGQVGDKRLLDAFELQCINDGTVDVFPVDGDGLAVFDESTAVEIKYCADGLHIVWQSRVQCDACHGFGHYNMYGAPVEEGDLCMDCDGVGYCDGPECETDMDGMLLPALEAAT